MKRKQIILTIFMGISIGAIFIGLINKELNYLFVIGLILISIPLIVYSLASVSGVLAQIKLEKNTPIVYYDDKTNCYHVDKECKDNTKESRTISRSLARRENIPLCPHCGAIEIAKLFEDK